MVGVWKRFMNISGGWVGWALIEGIITLVDNNYCIDLLHVSFHQQHHNSKAHWVWAVGTINRTWTFNPTTRIWNSSSYRYYSYIIKKLDSDISETKRATWYPLVPHSLNAQRTKLSRPKASPKDYHQEVWDWRAPILLLEHNAIVRPFATVTLNWSWLNPVYCCEVSTVHQQLLHHHPYDLWTLG